MSREFIIANSFLIGAQALLVAITGAGIPRWLERLKGPAWALILPLSIAIVVAAIEAIPEVANGLTWFALIMVPIGAALALGWAMKGARPPLAILALLGFVVAWWQTGTLAGDAVAAALTVLSAITVGRLAGGLVPGLYLRLGIIAMAIIDAWLVFTEKLQGPNATLNAAIPVEGAPRLQYLDVHYASMGYGDIFVAGVLGGILAAEKQKQLPAAALVLGLSILWDLLFLHFNTLPATVPVAVATALLWLIPEAPWRLHGELIVVPTWPPGRGVMLANYTGGTLVYRELIVFSHTTPKGAVISHIYVDDEQSQQGGINIWGLPKELATFIYARDHFTARQGDVTLLHAKIRRRTGRLPFLLPTPITSPMGETLGRARIKAAPALVKLEIPHNSPFAHLRLDGTHVALAGDALDLRMPPPR